MQELGNISYGLDIDIKSGEVAFTALTSASKKTEKQINSTDKAIDKSTNTQNKNTKSVNESSIAIDKQTNSTQKNKNMVNEFNATQKKQADYTQKNKNMVNEFNAAQKKQADYTQKNTTNLNQITQGIRNYTLGVSGADKAIELMIKELKDLEKQARKTSPALDKIPSSIPENNPTKRGIKGIGKESKKAKVNVQNMSYQLQDMAVQAQMGTSIFVILSQQLPQMLVGMGAWAGAIGVAVTVLGLMATTLIDTTTDIEKMEKAIEQVKAVITIGAGGVANYSDELKKLSAVSKELTQIKLNTALAQQQKALRLTGEAAKQAYEDATPFLNLNWDNYKNQQEAVIDNIIDDKEMDKLGRASPLIDNAINAVYGLDGAMKSIKAGRTDDAIDRITNSLDLLSRSSAVNTKAGEELITKLTGIVEQYKLGKLRADELKKAVEGTSDAFKGNASALKDYLDAIHISNTELQGNARAAEKLRLEKLDLEKQEVQTALAAWDYNQVLAQQKIDTEEAVKADKKRAESLKSVSDELDAFFDSESKQSKAQDDSRKATLTTQVQSIGLTPEDEIKARYDKELELLSQAEEQKIEIEGTYAERRTQIEKERQEAIRNMQSETSEFMENAFGNLDTQIAGTMAQVITGAKDGKEAMAALANTILTQVIGAVVQWGIAEVTKMMTVESAEKGMQAANAAATTASVSAQVAMNTALAAQNAFMATAAIPIVGPVLAPAAAAVAGAASASIGASAIPLAPLAGAREFGGPVTKGKSYLVGESGHEIFTPHTSGAITSNKDMSSGGSSMSVEVNNYTPYKVYVTRDEAAGIAKVEIGNESKKASQGRGVMYQGLSKGTNVKNNARR